MSVFVARQIFLSPHCVPAFSGRGALGMNRTCAMLILQLGALICNGLEKLLLFVSVENMVFST